MAGLLDALMSLSPEQNQGLLSAASALLQAGGPSRTPISFGQALGAGIGGFQQGLYGAQKMKQDQEEAQLQNALRSLQVQGLTGELQDKEKARKDQLAAQEWLTKYQSSRGAQSPMQAMGSNLAPTLENAAMLSSGQQQSAPQDIFSQRLAQAQAMRDSGNPILIAQADALEKAALSARPKYSTDFRTAIGPDGKLHNYVLADDGSFKDTGLAVAPKLRELNLGGTTQLIDDNNVTPGQVFKRTLTPGESATNALGWANYNLSKDRFGLEKDKAAQDKAPTEFSGKSAAFGLRARNADDILTGLTGKYSPAAINSKTSVADWPLIGGALGAATNFALSENDQKAEQAQRDFINAVLRQESGAVIGPSEFDNARKQYFPQPGDSQSVIEQKARNRQLAIQGLENNAGRAKMTPNPFNQPSSNGWGIQRVN